MGKELTFEPSVLGPFDVVSQLVQQMPDLRPAYLFSVGQPSG